MPNISAAGIGSGLDVKSILTQLVDAERAPTENRLNARETELNAELSAFGLLNSSISTFQSSLGKLQSPSSFSSIQASVSDTAVLSAATTGIAQDGNYTVEVSNLAQPHTLASIAFTNINDVIGTGTLNFSFGTTVYDPGTSFAAGDDTYTSFTKNADRSDALITIDNTNNTISGIRDAINSANIGVSAAIVDDGSGFRLLIASGQRGIDNSMEITVDEGGLAADNTDTSGLSLLAFNSVATNTEQTQSAQDAQLTVNGLSVNRDSNLISGVIPGVNMTLNTTNIGTPVLVSVTNSNVSQAKENITSFVNSFNDMTTVFNGLTKYGQGGNANGVLLGDTTARNILQQTRRELGGLIENGGNFNSLSSIGVKTKLDGTLEINDALLSKSLNEDFDSVAQLFYANGNAANSNVSYVSSNGATQPGTYAVYISAQATQGNITGESLASSITIDATNNTFSMFVDGISTNTISINQATYTDFSVLAQELQNQINADSQLQVKGKNVSVTYNGSGFDISSSSYGSESSVKMAIQNSDLGLTSNAVIAAGTDVSGLIDGQLASGTGQFLTGSASANGLKLEITGNTIGDLGNVTYSRGLASMLDALLGDFLSADGQLTAKTESISGQLVDLSTERATFLDRLAVTEERYRKQFSSLDVLISQLNFTSNYLQQQLDTLPGVIRKK